MIKPARKVTPFIWYESQAEDAAKLYTSLVPNSRILDTSYWTKGSPYPAGSVMSVTFELDGQQYIAFNGGPHFKINEAFSIFVSCEDQAEVDRYWDALIADGGAPSQCAWLRDKFGVSWQIVPKALMRVMGDKDPERAARGMQAMMKMQKIDIAELERAAAG